MIFTETVTIAGREFVRTYSDAYKIRKVGTTEVYEEAYDLPGAGWSYEETEESGGDEITDSEALTIITGGARL